MQTQRKSLYFLRISSDILLILISFILAMEMSIKPGSYWIDMNNQVLLYSLIVIWFLSSKSTGLYDEFRSSNFVFELITLIKNIFLQSISAIVIMFLLEKEILSKFFIIVFSSYLLILLTFEKYFFRKILHYFRKRGRNLRHLIIVGGGEVGNSFFESVANNPHFGYKILGFLDDNHVDALNGTYLGRIDDLDKILSNNSVDDVVFALPSYESSRIYDMVRIINKHAVRASIIPDYNNVLTTKFHVSTFGDLPIITLRNVPLEELQWRIVKRLFDIVFSFLVIVFILSWLIPITYVLQKIFSPGPSFFIQDRVGRHNKIFRCYKFRTMDVESSKNLADYQVTEEGDPRITRFGRLLRKSNLDEFPQFINVLKGDMSVVGPRPHALSFEVKYSEFVEEIRLRHRVKPGITGWAQISGLRGDVPDEEKNRIRTRQKIEHDIWYIENWSLWLDIQIIFYTIVNMLKGNPHAH